MLPFALINLIMSFILIALVSGNNLPVCSGSIIAAKIVNRKTGILLTVFGYVIGLALQGSLLRYGLNAILPVNETALPSVALFIAMIIFLIAHKWRVPQSLSITFSMAILGISMAYTESINWTFVGFMLGLWIFATGAALVTTFVSMKMLPLLMYKRRVWRVVGAIKPMLIVTSFLAAFTLGANTIGFVSTAVNGGVYTIPVFILAIIVGSVFLSRGELKRIGHEILPLRYANALVSQFVSVILVELATLFGVPLSNTQTFTMGLYGVGLGYKTRLIRTRPAMTIFLTWTVTAIVSLILGYVMTKTLIL